MMKVAVIGGGPGGLFLATLLRGQDASIDVTVFERNRAEDTFGFGVVFSDRTLEGLHEADPVLRQALDNHGRHWDEIEVRLKGERFRCGGNGMAAVARHTLLRLMQARAQDLGAVVRFSSEVTLDDLDAYDIVVAADGSGSLVRHQLAEQLDVTEDIAEAKFIWFGTDYMFDGLTFVHEASPHGTFAVHGYPISDTVSTFIVETAPDVWLRAGLDEFDVTQPPGPSDPKSKDFLQQLFAEQIDGRELLVNNSRWASFTTRRTRPWPVTTPRPIALLGDAVHTAHFSVGSGTKMAMEDAVALAAAIIAHPNDVEAAFEQYELTARPPVDHIQQAAHPSLAWWERFGIYHDAFEPWQFAYHFLTRSITDERLGRRDADFVAASHRAWTDAYGTEPLQSPLALDGWSSPGRSVAIVEEGGAPVAASTGDTRLPLRGDGGHRGAWGGLLRAPDDEADLAAAREQLDALVAAGPACVAVHGGTDLGRTQLCEDVRLRHGMPALLIDDELDRDRAVTVVLSGRADLVGVAPDVAAEWAE